METSIVRGMPYATMVYKNLGREDETMTRFPTVVSQINLLKPPVADGKTIVACSETSPEVFKVEKELELLFTASDFKWILFVSEPVMAVCVEEGSTVQLQIVGFESPRNEDSPDLVLRVALLEQCSTNSNPIYCHQEQMDKTALRLGQGQYRDILRQHVGTYPGPKTSFSFSVDEKSSSMELQFDWDPQYIEGLTNASDPVGRENIAFALPHHFDMMSADHFAGSNPEVSKYCSSSLLGPTCLVAGSVWKLAEAVPAVSLRSLRAPDPDFIHSISQALRYDMQYSLPEFYRRGAGDTYFSGKMLSKLGRILVAADELLEICGRKDGHSVSLQYKQACNDAWLPSKQQFEATLEELRSSVEIWIGGNAEIPFVFDSSCEFIIAFALVSFFLGTCSNLLLIVFVNRGRGCELWLHIRWHRLH